MNIVLDLLNVREIAVFMIDDFRFGVDTCQIQEIVTCKTSEVNTAHFAALPFWLLNHHQKVIPVFSLRRYLGIPGTSSVAETPSSLVTCITFLQETLRLACQVSAVENVIPVSFRSLKPVPPLLTPVAQHVRLWGFYESRGTLIPLVDLACIIPRSDIELYIQSLG